MFKNEKKDTKDKTQNEKTNWDFLIGIFSIVFGIMLGFFTYITPKAIFTDPYAPLYFPYAISVSMIIIGFILAIKNSFTHSLNAIRAMLKESTNKKLARKDVFYATLICIVYALLFEKLGYVISTILFLLALCFLTKAFKSYFSNIIFSTFFSIFAYVIFAVVLEISIPAFPFEIPFERLF